mgnify:CR=1 FL=1
MKSKRVGNEFMLPDNAAKPEKVKQLEEWRGIQDGVTLQMCLLQEGLVPKSFSCFRNFRYLDYNACRGCNGCEYVNIRGAARHFKESCNEVQWAWNLLHST